MPIKILKKLNIVSLLNSNFKAIAGLDRQAEQHWAKVSLGRKSCGSTACRAIFLTLSALEKESFFYRLRSNQRGRMLSIVGDFGKIGLAKKF